ncbi:Glycosyltransferase involved in cell wall bisynthesis [Mariprofundus ferrinatatus]|uniref:Glycosyltransferase involved in cell wall bisynthesis n=2 Tax=Mariprofundus ferrinatatus TaxID=1921087 RepID=A0A2K8L0Z8_9PROT|nr:Glycosyltransferase involved in cell wall bisynthesis [Mariprofundus ferrinatatus]
MHVLIISALWPEPASSGAGLRMMELSRLFVQQGWRVTYAATAAASEYSLDIKQFGIAAVEIRVNDSSFDTIVSELSPDIVLFDRFSMEEQFGWRVERCCPEAVRIVETIDLHLLRNARHSRFKQSHGVACELSREELFSETAMREIASLLRSDLSILVSGYEMDLLEKVFGIDASLLHCCPFMFDASQIAEDAPAFTDRSHFITIGNFRHAPNWDAVLWLKSEIWPRIRKALPDAELHIYGAYTPPKATALDDPKSGFRVLGRAEDVHKVMQSARVCLAPLRFGAGIKTKLADAMLNGTPNVTTSVGAEGMHGELPWSGIVADSADAFADAAVKLYRDGAAWQSARQHGFDILKRLFDAETNGAALISRITGIREDLQAHRLKNFTGAMLRHHHQRSTEFMSRWIEAKNVRS